MGKGHNGILEEIHTYCNVLEAALAMLSKFLNPFLFHALFLLFCGSRSNRCMHLECKCTQGFAGLFCLMLFGVAQRLGPADVRLRGKDDSIYVCGISTRISSSHSVPIIVYACSKDNRSSCVIVFSLLLLLMCQNDPYEHCAGNKLPLSILPKLYLRSMAFGVF